jgi:hypothetical protein
MYFRRILGLSALVVTMMFAAPGTAYAEPYPAGPPNSEVSHGTVEPGGSVTFTGEGFLPHEPISIAISYEGSNNTAAFSGQRQRSGGFVLAAAMLPQRLATITTTADANGRFSVEVPLAQAGSATLTATGLTSGVTVSSVVEVSGDGGNGGGGGGGDNGPNDGNALPTTGPSGTPMLITVSSGVGAVLLGAALVWLVRARRRSGVM